MRSGIHGPLFFTGLMARFGPHFSKNVFTIFQLNDDFGEIMNLYSGFIGKEHFTSLVRLLGYSGIALTIKGCILPNSKTLLKNTILVYFKSLQVKCRLLAEKCLETTIFRNYYLTRFDCRGQVTVLQQHIHILHKHCEIFWGFRI